MTIDKSKVIIKDPIMIKENESKPSKPIRLRFDYETNISIALGVVYEPSTKNFYIVLPCIVIEIALL